MGSSGHLTVISLVINQMFFPSGKSCISENNVFTGEMMPHRINLTTHLVKHSVSKTQQLPEEVEPAVQEGKETQQKEHYT